MSPSPALIAPALGGFWNGLLVASTIGTAVGVVAAAGEEIGWRGYMVIRLIDAGVQRPVLVSGVIWGLWHVPLIVIGVIYSEHPARLVAILVFMVRIDLAVHRAARGLQQRDPRRVLAGCARHRGVHLGGHGDRVPRRGRVGPPRAGALPWPVDLPARAGPTDVSTGRRPHGVAVTGCRMAELSRFQTLIAAIDSSRDESSFSS